jgi:uncharacterized protein (TIGR04255 family)
MPDKRHLKNAPIREALIDMRFSPAVSIEKLEKVKQLLSDRFPNSTDIWEASLGYDIQSNQSQVSHRAKVGFRLDAPKVPRVLQLRVNGFAFSQLAPYDSWEAMKKEACDLWSIFRNEVQFAVVNRVAVRYINEIKIPLPFGDFNEYLNVAPDLPEKLPQTLGGFVQRYVMVKPDETTAIVTQVLEDSFVLSNPNEIKIFLDIDVFKNTEFLGSSDECLDLLESLRDFKNDVFFEYLTEKALEMYE